MYRIWTVTVDHVSSTFTLTTVFTSSMMLSSTTGFRFGLTWLS